MLRNLYLETTNEIPIKMQSLKSW